jgi:tripartite-type tricarboxylate transporter receptor subunit TctC
MKIYFYLLLAFLLSVGHNSYAQSSAYPNKTIKIIVPVAPGGNVDMYR